jgi:hypothetical protein
VHTEFWWGNPRERDHFQDPGVDARMKIGGGVDLSASGQWQVAALVNAIMNIWVAYTEFLYSIYSGPSSYDRLDIRTT